MTLVWLLAALLIALGAAGIVAGMDTPAADGSDRTGRTGYGDAQVDASLDAIETQIGELSVAVEMLGQHSRVILASLSSNSTEAIDTATAHGTALVGDIKARVQGIRDALADGSGHRESCARATSCHRRRVNGTPRTWVPSTRPTGSKAPGPS